MTHKNFIDSIIEKRGQWTIPTDEYGKVMKYEMHHIVPECMGGESDYINSKGAGVFRKNSTHYNCVYLTLEEHWLAHKLLQEENPWNNKLSYSYWMMCNRNKNTSEKDYSKSKECFIKSCSGNNHWDTSGENNPMYGTISPFRGKHWTEEMKIKSRITREKNKDTYKKRSKEELSQSSKKGILTRRKNGTLIPSKITKEKMSKKRIELVGVKVICIETGIHYTSLIEAANDTGASRIVIQRCCKNPKYTSGGYHWKYEGEINE